MKSRHQRKTRKSQRRKRRLQRQLQVERRASFESLEDRMLLAADLGAVDLPIAEGEELSAYYMPPVHSVGGDGYQAGFVLGESPMNVATDYLAENASGFGLQASDLDNHRVLSQYVSSHTGVTHIALQQQHEGLDVLGSVITVNVNHDGRIVSAGSSFVSGLTDSQQNIAVASGNPVDALVSAADQLGLTFTESPQILSESPGIERDVSISDSGFASGTIDGHLVFMPTPTGVELSWAFIIQTDNQDHAYHAIVSADDGQMLMATDGVMNARYNVFPVPGMNPGDTGQQILVDPANSLGSPFGWHDTNAIEGAEFTDTRGNNVFVQVGDIGLAPNTTGFRTLGGDDLEFLSVFDPIAPRDDLPNQEAAVTNAFYVMNTIHDDLFNYGFDEAAGNFQANNYTAVGVPGDPMQVDVSDPDALPCNAFVTLLPTHVDGFAPPMEVGYCANSVPGRDSALDNSTVIHEFGHALTSRLVGGPFLVQGAAQNSQIGGMHEGNGDYLALMYAMDINDRPEDAVTLFSWDSNIEEGIRRQPYSYDLSIDPITFANFNATVDPTTTLPNSEVHQAGEIWASMLWDMTWELMFKYGSARDASSMAVAFNPDLSEAVGRNSDAFGMTFGPDGNVIYTTMVGPNNINLDTGANNLAMQLFIDGMKLSIANPTFTDARDAILSADLALTGGVNHEALWRAFARRGLGFGAFGGPTTATVPVSQLSFELPPTPADISGVFFLDADADGIQTPNEILLPDWQVFLDLNGNGTHETLEPVETTNVEGEYNFKLYTGGTFKVHALPEPGFLQTLPDPTQIPGQAINDGSQTVFVVTGNSTSGVDFGFTPAAASLGIFGTKYEDLNGNGSQDGSEPGMGGVYVYVDIDHDQRIDFGEPAAITAEDGSYVIEFIEPGPYEVREVLAPGWRTTEPANIDGQVDINIVPGVPTVGVDFGNQAQNDYGDAPAPYATLIADGGAVHGILSGFSLGTTVDSELDGNPSIAADGDDLLVSDDEDGIRFNNDLPLVKGLSADIEVTVTNGSNSGGVVQGWIDYNADGDWNDAGEHVVVDQRIPEGTSTLTIAVPEAATVGLTYARFRYGYERGIGPTGAAMAGEVEDYQILILDDNPVALDDFFAVTQDSANNQLDVLANDFASSTGALTIVSVGTPDQGGAVSITPDGSTLFYTPANNFSTPPLEIFTYTVGDSPTVDCLATPERCSTATVQVEVQTIFQDPLYVDDYRNVVGADANPPTTVIDVIANDIEGANGPLTLVPSGLTQPANGSAQVDLANNQILYTPNPGFYNLDTFSYTVVDSNNNTPEDPPPGGYVTVQVSKPGGGCSPDQELASCDDGINYIVETINPVTGAPITQINVGQEFEVRVSIQDARGGILPADAGLYAAFMDVLYDADFVNVKPSATPIIYGPEYAVFHEGDVSVPGVVDELGAVQTGIAPLGNGAIELASMTFIAKAVGSATIQLDQADLTTVTAGFPLHDSLVHEPSTNQVVDHAIINYGASTVIVNATGGGGGGGGGEGERLDTSGDGVVSPLDALQIINDLNVFGARAITPNAEGEIATPNWRLDVNNDNFISPVDALAVITYLNNHSSVTMPTGEGEAPADVVELLAADQFKVAVPVSTVADSDSADVVAIDSQAPVVADQPRQAQAASLDLGRWMTSSDADEAGQEDLESLIDSLADDVSSQWNGQG